MTPGVENIQQKLELYSFEVDLDFDTEALIQYISGKGILLTGIEEKKMSLEDEFLQITKKSRQ